MTQIPREDERSESTGPTVRDRRRIDPDTYQLREPQATAAPGPGADQPVDPDEPSVQTAEDQGPTEVDRLTRELAERTADLQRLQAEYVNYKRRVDRDRDVSRTNGVESVLRELLPVLDSISSAREHGELTGGFKGVSEELEKVASRHGLTAYGQAGDPFDPMIHEALMHMHAPADDVITGPTCVQILQPGYKIGERILRPARVAVAEPSAPAADPADPTDPADPANSANSTTAEPASTDEQA